MGATGFDGMNETRVARRGILVGLVKNPGKRINSQQ